MKMFMRTGGSLHRGFGRARIARARPKIIREFVRLSDYSWLVAAGQ